MERYVTLAQGQLPISVDVLYTVPSGHTAIVRHIRLANPTVTDRNASLHQGGTGNDSVILPPTAILAGGWGEFDGMIIMGPGEVLYGTASAATAITYTIYGVEAPV